MRKEKPGGGTGEVGGPIPYVGGSAKRRLRDFIERGIDCKACEDP